MLIDFTKILIDAVYKQLQQVKSSVFSLFHQC